jgi:hypothetical protein
MPTPPRNSRSTCKQKGQILASKRLNFEIIGDGEGFHWPDLDEDLSVRGFLAGIRLDQTPNVA